MKLYFKNITFNFLDVVSASINCFCSILGFYPTVNFGVAFLSALEVRRMKLSIEEHLHSKSEILKEADALKAKAEKELNARS